MAYCTNCGHQLADGAKFCFECGAKVDSMCSVQAQERKIIFEGELRKCPQCGETIDSFVANCPSCGHEFRGTKNSTNVSEFATQISLLESERTSSTNNYNLKTMLKNYNEVSETDQKKISLIRNYIVPNTREDIVEFLVLASSNINTKRYNVFEAITESEKAVSDAWEAKFDQAYQKATIMFSDDPTFERFRSIYNENRKAAARNKWSFPLIMIGSIVGVMVMMLFLVLIVSLTK